MATAGFQQQVFFPNVAMPGDWYGLPPFQSGEGFIAASPVGIGTFVWGVNGSPTEVTQAQGANTQLAGFVVRNNANVFPVAAINVGYSLTIDQGYQCEVVCNGSFYAAITISYNAGNVINIGDAIWVNTTTGTLAVGVIAQPNYFKTNYVVINNSIPNNVVPNMVAISNPLSQINF